MTKIKNTYSYFMSWFRDIGDIVTWSLCPGIMNDYFLSYSMVYKDLVLQWCFESHIHIMLFTAQMSIICDLFLTVAIFDHGLSVSYWYLSISGMESIKD